MATATPTTLHAEVRRGAALPLAAMMTPGLRAEIVQRAAALMDEARSALNAAQFLIECLDAADRPMIDLEPDHDGEEEPDEAAAQPVTLAPHACPLATIRPTAAEMRAAYRRNGDPVPRNLRRWPFGSARA